MEIPEKLPTPPRGVLEAYEPTFMPDEALSRWTQVTFIDPKGELFNPRYEANNLRQAHIGFLWASEECVKKGKFVAGRCQLGEPSGGDTWNRGKKEQQLREWFGDVPDFLITLDAEYFQEADVASRLALLEHELHHAGQQTDEFGMPAFNQRTGRPKWEIKPHDLEEFTGVVQRYGARAANAEEFVEAAREKPTIGRAQMARACGTCLRQVA